VSKGIEYLKQIQRKANEGKVVLFIRAGASISAGAPSSAKLTELVKKKFPSAKIDSNDFMQVCNEVLETEGIDRHELEEYIVRQFDTLKPTQAHLELIKYNWAAIFTTNFDDLIETAYKDDHRLKPCHPLSGDDFQFNPGDRSRVYLFKFMGSITYAPDGSLNLVLSRSDYLKALRKRSRYLEYLEDIVKDGTIVFVGYSGKDGTAFEIIDEVLEKVGPHRLPYSYSLFREMPTAELGGRFAKRKIIPVECSFEEFFDFMKKSPDTEYVPVVVQKPAISIKVKGTHFQIDAERLGPYQNFGQILNDELLANDVGKMDDFFRGTNKSWAAFGKHWDFIRRAYSDPNYERTIANGRTIRGCLRNRVIQELGSTDPSHNRVLLLTGIPGTGKSMMLRRLAYDMYAEGFCPVLVLDPNRWSFDLKLLDTTVVELSRARDEVTSVHQRLKTLVIIDDAPSLMIDPASIRDYFSSRSTPVVVVAAGRDNEWTSESGDPRALVSEEDIFRVSEQLDQDEKGRMVKHLYELGYLNTADTTLDSII
jgi:SIR2-like domain